MAKKYPYDTVRLRRVAELAATKANWGKKKSGKGSGMGIAVHRSFLTYVATVVEVEVDDQGAFHVPPRAARRSMQGSLLILRWCGRIWGCGGVLEPVHRSNGEITATAGVIDQSNFFDYPGVALAMNDAPRHVDVQIVETWPRQRAWEDQECLRWLRRFAMRYMRRRASECGSLPLTRNGFS